MSPSSTSILLGLALLLLPACGEEPAPSVPVEPEIVVSMAWVGEHENGLKILAETLPDYSANFEGAVQEETMLRKQLSIPREEGLLRVHLLGTAQQLANLDQQIHLPGDREYRPLGPSSEAENARSRLLRAVVADGGPSPEGLGPKRRTLLMSGPGEPPTEAIELRWVRDDLEIPLRARRWNERERRKFFEPPAADKSDD